MRYRTHPDAAEENARLVEAVFTSLGDVDPGGMEYTMYQLADGPTT